MFVALATTTLTEAWGTVVVVVAAPWPCPWLDVVDVVVDEAAWPAAAVVVVDPPVAAAVVEVVCALDDVVGVERVPTATRMATATTKTTSTTAARASFERTRHPPGVLWPVVRHPCDSFSGQACRATMAEASLSAGRKRWSGLGIIWPLRPSSSVGRALHL